MFENLLKTLANSKSLQHRIIAQGIAHTYANVDGTYALALRAMPAARLLAIVGDFKRNRYSTVYEIKGALWAMRDQFVTE